eukprot:TRINITY_DN15399_c0_g1_i2.p2 TRINITY_DN15399_c0_g1~~TRINITY_DN15399_c0_g1_i2.p2  ORF type:complete len:104 (-),score=4.70 TRINITY_DN15399_c0_g1_i2:109-420(-)
MVFFAFFFFKQKTAYEIMPSLVGSEMCIRDSLSSLHRQYKSLLLYIYLFQKGSRRKYPDKCHYQVPPLSSYSSSPQLYPGFFSLQKDSKRNYQVPLRLSLIHI